MGAGGSIVGEWQGGTCAGEIGGPTGKVAPQSACPFLFQSKAHAVFLVEFFARNMECSAVLLIIWSADCVHQNG